MGWKKYFQEYKPENTSGQVSPVSGSGQVGPARTNYSSFLPDVYSGHPNRVERYGQYETMDSDSEVNAALDILAEFCTQENMENKTPFQLFFKQQATGVETKILKQYLQQWVDMNQFDRRIFRVMRNVFKYGDAFFVRDPETFKLFHIDPAKVNKVIVNESEGKEPEQYVISDINVNFQHLSVSQKNPNAGNGQIDYTSATAGGGFAGANSGSIGTRFDKTQNQATIEAEHVVHLSLSEGLDRNFPFGNSLLESVFKVYKQKELLEDAIIIYRVQRAPERRVFYIDVGNMPTHLAMGFVERIKNEIHQRRIPSATGGGTSVIDASFNPLSINEDYFFPQTAEGRGSKVETLPGGTNLGEIDDLKYFTNKLFRGLRIPSSYLPTGSDDSAAQYNDGRVGTAYIQELRFNKYCVRLQNLCAYVFDREFKMFMNSKGVNIDNNLFDLKMNPPQNFASYRQSEMDNARVNTFASLQEVPYMSKRFALKRFLGLSQEELAENESMWREENTNENINNASAGAEMRGAGVTPSGIQSDLDDLGTTEPGVDAPEPEIDVTTPDTTPGGDTV
jgi:hypothetical protein|tara:strand:- start:9563 stop:11254 length:1692 start_codon:yes stop_codon:yes gene_type:complete